VSVAKPQNTVRQSIIVKAMNIRLLSIRRLIWFFISLAVVLGLMWSVFKCKRDLDRQVAIDLMTKDGAKFEWLPIYNIPGWQKLLGLNSNPFMITFQGNCSESPLTHLADLKGLYVTSVFITKCRVTGEGLCSLRDLPDIDSVWLDNVELGNSGLINLLDLPRIRSLTLHYTPLSDKDFLIVCALKQLKCLELVGIDLREKDLGKLKMLKELRILDLIKTRVSDSSLEHLPLFPTLRCLNLSYTEITDRSLDILKKQSGLSSLYLQGTEISKNGLYAFHKAMPNIDICDTNGKYMSDTSQSTDDAAEDNP
jgi:hypothetical protein